MLTTWLLLTLACLSIADGWLEEILTFRWHQMSSQGIHGKPSVANAGGASVAKHKKTSKAKVETSERTFSNTRCSHRTHSSHEHNREPAAAHITSHFISHITSASWQHFHTPWQESATQTTKCISLNIYNLNKHHTKWKYSTIQYSIYILITFKR